MVWCRHVISALYKTLALLALALLALALLALALLALIAQSNESKTGSVVGRYGISQLQQRTDQLLGFFFRAVVSVL
jgi:hypothetical protein